MPWPWIPPRGEPEKKAVFSPHYGDETATNYSRANEKLLKGRGEKRGEFPFIQKRLCFIKGFL